MIHHGGRLRQAAIEYARPLDQWIDLSTGINPHGWPVPPLPACAWQRLPEPDDDLQSAAQRYYGCQSLLPLAGSQAAIQTLPQLHPRGRVAIPAIGYREHDQAWRQAGHEVISYQPHQLGALIDRVEVVVVIQPNNPTGLYYPVAQLRRWHQRLSARGGRLLVDEAFIDPTPDLSLAADSSQPGLIILRSIGKFFGLAGLRAGFMLAEPELCQRLDAHLGPWALSHPARWVCTQALQDTQWQQDTRARLTRYSLRLAQLLATLNPYKTGGCALFQTLYHPHAVALHEHLARAGILTRRFTEPDMLRLGLPANEHQWQRLSEALSTFDTLEPYDRKQP